VGATITITTATAPQPPPPPPPAPQPPHPTPLLSPPPPRAGVSDLENLQSLYERALQEEAGRASGRLWERYRHLLTELGDVRAAAEVERRAAASLGAAPSYRLRQDVAKWVAPAGAGVGAALPAPCNGPGPAPPPHRDPCALSLSPDWPPDRPPLLLPGRLPPIP
jgi:hypothetical protein